MLVITICNLPLRSVAKRQCESNKCNHGHFFEMLELLGAHMADSAASTRFVLAGILRSNAA